MRQLFLASAGILALSGCVSLAPSYEGGEPQVPGIAGYTDTAPSEAALLHWTSVFKDPQLSGLIETALANNRELREAAANTERVRALYRVQRAELAPQIATAGSWTRNRIGPNANAFGPVGVPIDGEGSDPLIFDQYSVNLATTAWELDLFGRIRSLSREALLTYFSTEAGQRAAEVALISEVATAYFNLLADMERLRIAEATLDNQQEAFELTTLRAEGGVATVLDVDRVVTTIASLEADRAVLTAQIRQDQNALRLLLGIDELPAIDPRPLGSVSLAGDLPPAVPSEVLLLRPDVQSAEYELRAADANIGAARAAFLPRISLTASGGTSSADLDALFSDGTGVWSFSPSVNVPIFTAGRLRGSLGASKAARDAATAAYEGAVQSAFRDVSDALAVQSTIEARLEATRRQAEASERVFGLENDRYEAGIIAYFSVLDAQRESYAARTALVSAELARAVSAVNLYRALGGGEPGSE